MQKMLARGVVALGLCLTAGLLQPAFARDIYVDPTGVNETATGAPDAPYQSVFHALRHGGAKGGDRVILRPGAHGFIKLAEARFDPPLQIIAQEQGTAHVSGIQVQNSSGLSFQGLSVWPLPGEDRPKALVKTFANTANITFDQLDVRSTEDAPETYLQWTKAYWTGGNISSGVVIDGPDSALTNSRITATGFAITTTGDRARVFGNMVEGFSGDAMRGIGDGSHFAGNQVRNCFKVSQNHDDGFQSWAVKESANGRKEVSDIIVENNVILEWIATPDHPLRCTLQGIGLFDGHYRNFTIRNNLIVISAYHGIALYAGIDTEIVNNTVVHSGVHKNGHPWIMLSDNRNGWEQGDNTVINNVAMAYRGIPQAAARNAMVTVPARMFKAPFSYDFSPAPDGVLIDAGVPAGAPEFDIRGIPRDDTPDLGAFEMP